MRRFNRNSLNFEKHKEINNFLNFSLSNWLTPQILGPIGVPKNQKKSLFNNTYLSFSSLQCSSGNLFEKISDHLPNVLIVKDLSVFRPQRKDLKRLETL